MNTKSVKPVGRGLGNGLTNIRAGSPPEYAGRVIGTSQATQIESGNPAISDRDPQFSGPASQRVWRNRMAISMESKGKKVAKPLYIAAGLWL